MTDNNSYLVRTSLHLSRQKFGKIDAIDAEGIILSHAENKALFAIQKLLDKTNYQGNLEGRKLSAEYNKFQFNGILPRLQFSPVEFLEACGLQRRESKRGFHEFNANERKEALNALKSLADKKFKIMYQRVRWEENNKESLTDVIVTECPLIQIMWGIFGMTSEEKKKFDQGEFTDDELLHRTTIGVELSPIFVDQIDGYFLLIPDSLFNDIRKQIPKGKYSKYIPLFIEWLILQAEIQRRAKSGWRVEINFKKLAYKLRMDKMIQQRKWKQIRDKLDECYEIAEQLGYITEYNTVEGKHESKEVFYLNRDRFALPKKSASSTQKRSVLYPKSAHSLPKKGALIENSVFATI